MSTPALLDRFENLVNELRGSVRAAKLTPDEALFVSGCLLYSFCIEAEKLGRGDAREVLVKYASKLAKDLPKYRPSIVRIQ